MSESAPSPDSVAARIEALREEIRAHDVQYYTDAQPTISDKKYDQLMEELLALEAEHPDLITDDSPTQRVGGEPIDGFVHVRHTVPMLSIDNTYDEAQLREFDSRITKLLEGEAYSYVADPKIDGVAISLRYERGKLILAATRGDGLTGDDVTHTAKTIRNIPLNLSGDDIPEVLEIRGEACWPWKAFNKFNAQREAVGEPQFANPRNATAGTLKQLDPRNVQGRGLSFIAHGFGVIEPMSAKSYSELLDQFKAWGIPVSDYWTPCQDIDAVIDHVNKWSEKRLELPYETDGMVIKIDRFSQREALGSTSRYPRWLIAYKYEAQQAETVLLGVDFQVGKLGTITPRAVMEPVQLSGTTVQHASLHNFDQIERLDIRIGDTVIVQKAGEIIPQVVSVVTEKRPKGAKRIAPPETCPVCDGQAVRDEGGVYVRCINPSCPAQIKERLIYFVGRNQMDIEGAGQIVIETLVEQGLVHTFADLYRLSEETLFPLKMNDRSLGEKNATKLLQRIEKSKNQPLSRVLAALNIRHVGGTSAELLAEHFGSMEAISDACQKPVLEDESLFDMGEDAQQNKSNAGEQLLEIDGIGPEIAASLCQFFTSDSGRKTWHALRDAGVNTTQPKRESSGESPLAKHTIVVTGTLDRFTRSEIQARIKSLGGKVSSSVSKKTDFVLVGESPGSKAEKATKLGVPLLDEATFIEQFGK